MPEHLVPTPAALALVNGEPWLDIPDDLYIPPDALEIILKQFEGPLDLLLYLIRKQKLDIAQLPVLSITEQYMRYIDAMQALRLELAGEYLVMAAMLTEIKSRILLPVTRDDDNEEEDPRAVLIRRLQEYELYKDASDNLDALPRLERDVFMASAEKGEGLQAKAQLAEVSLDELMTAMRRLLQRASHFEMHEIKRERLSTRAQMSAILATLADGRVCTLNELLQVEQGRMGVVVSFLALLELAKEGLVAIVQAYSLGPISIQLKGAEASRVS